MTIITKDKQSMLDIAIQEYGSINELFELATANNMSITDELEARTEIKIPSLEVSEPEVQSYYKKKFLTPATGLSATDESNMEQSNPCNLADLFR